jgi:dihydroorotate dehydrogenase electron transfer subunit
MFTLKYEPATVLRNEHLGPGHYLIELQAKAPMTNIHAGQFLILRCDPWDQYSLMRPFSILDTDPQQARFSIYYKILGRLSTRLTEIESGTKLDCLYPLGTSFPHQDSWRNVALIGGGVGLAPLLFLGKQLQQQNPQNIVTAFFGGGTADDLVQRLLADYDFPMQLATMDGSRGFKGNVVDLFSAADSDFDVVYTCGPTAMMAALQNHLPADTPAFSSLEEYMACGVGACLGCAAAIAKNGETQYKTVCKEGPVFDLRKVRFNQ